MKRIKMKEQVISNLKVENSSVDLTQKLQSRPVKSRG